MIFLVKRHSIDLKGDRMKRIIIISLVLVLVSWLPNMSQAETTAEKLGYPADARLLIIHADDIGMCHSANIASIEALEKGIVTSGSIMVPCPWFLEIAQYSREHPEIDLGLHLTLTAEWKKYRWRPLAKLSLVPNLLDTEGYMHHGVAAVAQKASPEEIKAEIRAQIDHALANGLKPSHLDSHMGTIYARPDYIKVAIELSEEYDIPFMMFRATPQIIEMAGDRFDKEMSEMFDRRGYPLLDGLYTLSNRPIDQFEDGYKEIIKNLPPGVHELIIHINDDSPEVQNITNSWRARVEDFTVFTSESMRQFIKDQNVHLISWKDLRKIWDKRVK
jgi:predicted glycoside hydrolase/deacetylase ChbG (UPF0249 family)